MSTSRPSSRDALLEAAVRVVLRDGLLALTLDAVAKEAGLSKGGILYHFPSKDALIAGMVEHFLRLQEADMDRRRAADPVRRGAWLRAYLDSSFDPPPGLDAAQARQLFVALLAAVAINPKLIDPVHEYTARWEQQLAADGGDPLDNLLVWLAADGLWLWELFGVFPADGELRASLIDRLRQRTRGKKR